MAVIGATQLEPVNILGSYVQGLEGARANRMARIQEAATLREMEEKTALRNMLTSAKPEDLQNPQFLNRLAITPGGAATAQSLSQSIASQRAAEKSELEIIGKQIERLAAEAGSFLQTYKDNPASLTKNAIAPWLTSAVERRLLNPEDLQTFEALPDDPNQLAIRLQQLQAQGMSIADQIQLQRPKGTTTEVGGIIVTTDPYTGKKIGSIDYSAEEQAARRAGASKTSITNVQEKAEAGKYGESLVADYTTLAERAETGRRFLPTLEQAQRALDAGLRTGFGAETVRQGARVLSALGEKNAEANAANAELFLAAGKENVLRRQIEQKGTQTASDADRIEQTFISLGTTTTANQFMLDVARAQINRDNEQQRFYQKWRKENGTFDGAEEAWLDGPGDKSLFDRPELKKYATPEKPKPELPDGFKRDNPAGG